MLTRTPSPSGPPAPQTHCSPARRPRGDSALTGRLHLWNTRPAWPRQDNVTGQGRSFPVGSTIERLVSCRYQRMESLRHGWRFAGSFMAGQGYSAARILACLVMVVPLQPVRGAVCPCASSACCVQTSPSDASCCLKETGQGGPACCGGGSELAERPGTAEVDDEPGCQCGPGCRCGTPQHPRGTVPTRERSLRISVQLFDLFPIALFVVTPGTPALAANLPLAAGTCHATALSRCISLGRLTL